MVPIYHTLAGSRNVLSFRGDGHCRVGNAYWLVVPFFRDPVLFVLHLLFSARASGAPQSLLPRRP